MFLAFRALHLFARSLSRIAHSLEELCSLYRLDLASRGITQVVPGVKDEVEVSYGFHAAQEED